MYYMLLDFFITLFLYNFLPFLCFYKRQEKYTLNEKRKIILINTISVAILFIGIRYLLQVENPVMTFGVAMLYYIINNVIWTKNNAIEIKNNKNNKKQITLNLKHILFFIILLLSLIGNIYFGTFYYKNINNQNNVNNKHLLQNCYDKTNERFENISKIFRTNCNESELLGEKRILCSYPNPEDDSKVNLLKSDDMAQCRKWFNKNYGFWYSYGYKFDSTYTN